MVRFIQSYQRSRQQERCRERARSLTDTQLRVALEYARSSLGRKHTGICEGAVEEELLARMEAL